MNFSVIMATKRRLEPYVQLCGWEDYDTTPDPTGGFYISNEISLDTNRSTKRRLSAAISSTTSFSSSLHFEYVPNITSASKGGCLGNFGEEEEMNFGETNDENMGDGTEGAQITIDEHNFAIRLDMDMDTCKEDILHAKDRQSKTSDGRPKRVLGDYFATVSRHHSNSNNILRGHSDGEERMDISTSRPVLQKQQLLLAPTITSHAAPAIQTLSEGTCNGEERCHCCLTQLNESSTMNDAPVRCSFCTRLCCNGPSLSQIASKGGGGSSTSRPNDLNCSFYCEVCMEIFCKFCCTINFDAEYDRILCLDCDRQ